MIRKCHSLFFEDEKRSKESILSVLKIVLNKSLSSYFWRSVAVLLLVAPSESQGEKMLTLYYIGFQDYLNVDFFHPGLIRGIRNKEIKKKVLLVVALSESESEKIFSSSIYKK